MSLLVTGSILTAQENIAVTTKVKAEAMVRRATAQTYDQNLAIGTPIQDRDWIRTGENGFGVLVFLDDKSQLKIQSGSEVEILGSADRQAAAISKQLMMQNGKVKAEIASQGERRFSIITPTSVASVKGTVFWMIVDPVEGDRIFVRDGQVLLVNSGSGDSVLVGEDETGSSTPDGQVGTSSTGTIRGTVQEYAAGQALRMTDVNRVSGTLPAGLTGAGPLTVSLTDLTAVEDGAPSPGEQVEVTGQVLSDGEFQASVIGPAGENNLLEIEFENPDGERKTLEVEY